MQRLTKLLCLKSDRRVVRKRFNELPMPVSVIKCMAEIPERDLVFTYRNGNAILHPNVEYDDIATAGVDIKTGNDTSGDGSDSQNENKNKNAIESDNQAFITYDN